jgi:hypothetical protein
MVAAFQRLSSAILIQAAPVRQVKGGFHGIVRLK